ncbi:glycosyltransferase family 9 protein [candidate division KSB1 bacterium]|nr:glycosyltransferase family 9 protein [candidate division KSB1 bacterium]
MKHRSMRLFELLLSRKQLSPNDTDLSTIKRILVIRQHDQLGDFLLSTPVLRALRQHFPFAHIALLTRSYTTDVARHNQFINDLLFLHDSGHQYSWQWFKELWSKLRAGYDLTIVLNTVSHSLSSDILAALSRPRYILGSEHRIFPGCKRNFLYNLAAPYDPAPKHQSQRNLDIVRYLGIDTADPSENMTITPLEAAWATQWLNEHTNSPTEIIFGLHPGAGKLENRWPVERFAAVLNHFYETYGIRWLVTWGPKEKNLGKDLKKQLSFQPIELTNVNLRQFAAVISRLPFFLCNDTGVLHVAAAAGTPLLSLFGPTDISQWKPLGDKFHAIQGKDGTVASVKVDNVIERITKIMDIKSK